MKHIASLLLALFSFYFSFSQITISPQVANFFTVYSKEKDSIKVTLTNWSYVPFEVTDINMFHEEYYLSDTAFTVSPWQSKAIWVYCDAVHNLNFMDFGLIESPTHGGNLFFQVFSSVKYRDAYYNSTQNKSHEALKTALKTLLATNYLAYSYDAARDAIFMDIDNKKNNGQGATVNTLECVYTGRTIAGFTNRIDAQNNYNFNTEHTIPQSLFNELLPMRSDMHHLFPVFANANSERANKPFNVVTNPGWQDGGSKSNSNYFEPRDVDKGIAARATLYFVLRYQDYQGFIAGQENILKQWHFAHLPTPQDTMRNWLVYQEQRNRNPLVDHPEFIESRRMAAVATSNSGPTAPELHAQKTLAFGSIQVGSSQDVRLGLSNQGPVNSLQITNYSFSNPAFSLPFTPNWSVPADSLRKIAIRFTPTSANVDYTSTLTLATNDPNYPTWTIDLIANSFPVGIEEELPTGLSVYPNPASDRIWLENQASEAFQVRIYASDGKLCRDYDWNGSKMAIEVSELPKGVYFLSLQGEKRQGLKKIVVE